VVLRKDRQNIVIAVENTGAQLASDDLGRIFDRFYRAEKSRSEPGTGLGLSLVAAVISLHDGKVWAQNTVQGVKIITELPRNHMDYRNVTQQT
jgi:signal transduction histidine kinase